MKYQFISRISAERRTLDDTQPRDAELLRILRTYGDPVTFRLELVGDHAPDFDAVMAQFYGAKPAAQKPVKRRRG